MVGSRTGPCLTTTTVLLPKSVHCNKAVSSSFVQSWKHSTRYPRQNIPMCRWDPSVKLSRLRTVQFYITSQQTPSFAEASPGMTRTSQPDSERPSRAMPLTFSTEHLDSLRQGDLEATHSI
ncbi:uncharacterized protein BT62DRAFT_1005354 [Guyanagaster necrorhizus]|uniref:Uncharacterized protein n=1 Tax=Guyanagaster necrorhizus TaxID=856835 RepID=A0A9P7VT12_9AGAR|nr:uncharacterized protein BT62DRAFT_1005354 [Guyanagaster necrorhizus MCA 3950]KAG7446956.1 hypothetical protein BT62DRAFT_1005354 [Guyanagaster necrorhizus MCA 3950]